MSFNKKYALRKTAAYGLVSCAVGLMLVGSVAQVNAEDVGPSVTEASTAGESPYVSSQAKLALQKAIAEVNDRTAFTSSQVVMEDTAKSLDADKQRGVETIKEAFDELPENVRKFVTGLSFYQNKDGYYGLTQSLAGSTRLNTQYYNLQNFDQALGTLYHEISHSIDGKTYTNDGPEYSLSRDEKVVPLLKAIEPNASIFETWSNLFAKYVMTRVNQDVARSENENKAMKYFDDLLGEALFGSKAYNQEGILSVQQDGVSVSIVNEGIQIKIDDGKKFRKGERLLLTVNMPQRNIGDIIPRGDIRIQGVTVGNVKLEYPNLGKTPRDVALTAFYEKMRAKELNAWTKADLDEYFEIQKLSDNVWGYVVLSFDSEKINALSNRTILLKSTELHKDQNVLENRMVYEKRLDLSDKGTNGTRINHKLIKEFANTHSDKWRLDLDDYMGMYDQLMPKTLDNEIIGTLNFNNETVKEFHLRPALWFDQIHDGATGNVTDLLANLNYANYYDYDSGNASSWRSVDVSQNKTYANYSDLLNTKVHHVNVPSQMMMVTAKSEKERIFKPGDMKQEFFLNSETSGLTVKSELIGTTQHYSMDKVNDYTTVADVLWSDDRSWGTFKPSEVIKGITTHYEWDVIYEKDKITIVNTNEVHMPKYAWMSELGPRLEIGKELNFDTNVVFKDIANWKYGATPWWDKVYTTSPISGTYHMYYHDSLNDETKEFTTRPYSYYLQTKESSILGSGDKLPHDVIVKYVDQTGKEIRLPKTIKDDVAYTDTYKYEPEAIDGYQYLGITEDSDPLEGIVGYRDKVITVKYQDLSQPITTTEKTKFNWRLHFKDTNGTQLKEDAIVTNYYEREVVTNSNGEKSFGNWAFVKQESTNTDGLNLTKAEIKETDNNGVATALFTIVAPGQNSEKYLKSVGDYQLKNYGTPLYYGLHDRIYNVENLQAPEVNKDVDIIYQAKDAVITLRLIDSDNPEKVYHTVDVPAFTNYEHNGLDTHAFDSFKSKGEILDNIPNEVALENEGKTIDVRLSSIKTTYVILYDVDSDKQLESIQITGVSGSNARYDVSSNYENLKDKYVIDDTSVLSGSYLFKSANNNPIVISLKHRTKDTIESKSITRTIFDVDSDDVFNNQIVTFERDKHTDLVTNASTYSDWRLTSKSNKWPSYSISKSVIDAHELQFHESPQFVNGNDASSIVEGPVLPEKVVTPDMLGESWNIIYNRQDRKLTIHYVDGEGKPLADDKVLTVKDHDYISFLNGYNDLVPMIDHYCIKELPDDFEINGQDYDVTITYGKIIGYVTNLNMSTQDSAHEFYPGNPFKDVPFLASATNHFDPKYDYLTRFIDKENILVRGDLRYDSIHEPVEGGKFRFVNKTNDLYMKDDTFSLDLNKYNQFLKDNDAVYKINALNVDSANYRSDILSRPESYLGFFDLSHPTLWTKDYVHDNYQVDIFRKEDGSVDYTEYIPNALTRLLDLKNMKYTKYSINDNNGIMTVPYADFNNITESILYFPTTVMVYYDEETQYPAFDVANSESTYIKSFTSRSFDVGKVDKLIGDINLPEYEIVTKPNDEGFYKVNRFEYFDKSVQGTENGEYDDRNKQYVFIAMKHKTQSETESKDVHRTINVHKPDGSVETITQTVIFTRTKTTDLVTNESTYTDWSSENPNYEAYDVPAFTGYKASQDEVESSKSTGTDEVVDVTYEPIEQSTHVKIINERGETLKDFEVTGKTDENVKINYPDLSELTPKYDLGNLPETWTVQKENNQDIVIIVKDKLTEESVTKEITRTINLHQPDDDKQEVQKVTFTGTKVTNEATGEITYKDWSTDDDTFKEYQVPAVEGYTASKESIPAEKVDKDAVDEVIDVDYVGNMQDITIEIVDENNKVLAMKDAHAKTGENIQYDMTKMFESFKDDYMAKDALSGTYRVQAKGNHVLIHAVKRHHSDSETKTITRIIHVTNPDGTQHDITQTVTFTRSKTTDLTNNQVTYGEWETSDDRFDEYNVPNVKGYTSNIGTVEAMKVTPETVSSEVSVSYTENVTETTEEKDFLRYIIVQKPDGSKETITQKVHGSRTKTVHEVSGDTSYSDWTLAQGSFDAYTPASIDGYNVRSVESVDVDTSSEMPLVEYVVYQAEMKDEGTQTETPSTSDSSTQTDNPETVDEGSQTEEPSTSDGSTQTDETPTTDEGTQTENPSMTDSETQTKAEVKVIYKFADGRVYKEFSVNADKGAVIDGSDLEMLSDDMDFDDDFLFYEVKGDGGDEIVRIVKKNTSDSETQTKAMIHVVYRNQDGTIYKEFDVQADKGTILDGSDLEMLPNDMNFTDEFTTYEVKGDGTDSIERTVKKQTSDSETQTKSRIHVVYRNADGTIYKEFDVEADKGTILDGSDLEMLPDDMNFTDTFTTYKVKGDGTDAIERTVKKDTSDSGTQTDKPDVKDDETQTKAMIHVVYRNQDGTVYKEFDVQADKGAILDGSDLEMLPDDMKFNDDFMFYEVKGDGTDTIERSVKKQTSDSGTQTEEPSTSDGSTQTDTPDSKDDGTQTDNPDTSDTGTQTKAEIKVVYKNADGTVYKEFVVNADKGAILDGSDLEMLSDDMYFDDDFMFYEVKGDGSDEIVRIVKKHVSDKGTQTETPETSDQGSQTDNPDTSDGSTQTDTPDVSDGSTQTDEPDTSDGSTQTDTPDSKDNGTQTDSPDTSDGSTQTDEPSTSDNGTQTDNPSTNDQGSQTDKPDTSDGSTQTVSPDSKDDGTQTNKPNVSDKGSQTDKPDIKDDATQTDRPKDEPIQSIPKQDGISKAKPLSNKVVNGYTGVQPIKSPSKVRLPKAGSVDNSELGLIGAAMSMLGSILGFVVYRKKH